MAEHKIHPVNKSLENELLRKINFKTKPTNSLGRLEEIALQIGLIQNSLTPKLIMPHILVFAGDHGIAQEGVSAYPQSVTWQMVMNFLSGGAAINVFCKQHKIVLKVIDAGVNYDFPKESEGLIHNKVAKGTANIMNEPAMSVSQAEICLETSARIVKEISATGCNIIGFGEMGIANTSSASLLMSVLCHIPIQECIGRGTGLNDAELAIKKEILQKVRKKHGDSKTPINALATYGGFEIAQIVGAILQAARSKMIILIDGYIASVAYVAAYTIEPNVKQYCIFCHQSQEQGHQLLLKYIDAKPVLNLNMCLGEGTGVAVAYPIIQSSILFLNNMASFDSAHIASRLQ